MTLEQLQQQRTQILNEIKRRGGVAKAPNFAKQLEQVEAQIRQLRTSSQTTTDQTAATDTSAPIDTAGPPVVTDQAMKTTSGASTIENEQAQFEADQNLQLNNPNQANPFGSRRITRDANGNITVTDTLSGDQQGILDRDETLSTMGRDLAINRLQGGGFDRQFNPTLNSRDAAQQRLDSAGRPFNPQLAQRTLQGDFVNDRRRIEDEVFKSLTRNVDREYQKTREEKEQWLANRGIPVGSKLFNDQMREVDERFDAVKSQAMGQAVQMGGSELGRSFEMQEGLINNQFNQQLGTQGQNFNQAVTQYGLNEQTIGNQLSQQQAVRNQNLGEVGNMSQLGSGVMLPQFQAYQGAQYNATNPFEIWLAQQQNNQQNRALNIQQQQANRAGSGGGGGGGAQPSSPFNNTPPPGL